MPRRISERRTKAEWQRVLTQHSLKPIAKCALSDPGVAEESAAWLERSRKALSLSGEQMASVLGCSVSSWWRWENGDAKAPHVVAIVIRRLLDAVDLDSEGRMRTA